MVAVFLTHTPSAFANYYGSAAREALGKLAEVRMNPKDQVLDADELAEHARGCEIVIGDRQTPATGSFFGQAGDLVAFLRCAVDIRTIDVEAASRHGILVTRAPPGFAASVAELALGLMIDLARGVSDATLAYRGGRNPSARMGRQLGGSTLGIIGYGVIGQHLASLATALGISVLVNDPYKKVDRSGLEQTTLDTLLASSDFVVCLAPANSETENLMGREQFARMKSSAFFLNLARGNLVDEAALEDALNSGLIAGAALDVGRAPDQMPSPHLARRADIVATPHIGGLTPAAVERQAFDTVEQVRALLAGERPAGAVNFDAATRLANLQR